MKKLLLVAMTFFSQATSMQARAQWTDAPTFGVFPATDHDMKECGFDKNAPAVVLLDRARSYPGQHNELVTDRVVRLKILNEAGLEHGDISIRYYAEDDFEHISDIEAVVVNTFPDGRKEQTLLDKKNIYRNKINEKTGVVTFALPGVKKGSLIEYRYISTMKHYGGLQDWDFQSYLPTVKSSYHLTLLNNSEFVYRVQKNPSLPITVKQDKQDGAIYFEMNNVAGLRNEPYMDSRMDYIQKVSFQLSAYGNAMGRAKYLNSWQEVSKEMLGHASFGAQLNKRLDGAKAIITASLAAGNKEAQLAYLFHQVRGHMQWNGFYGLYAGNGVKNAWNNRKGSAGDINLALVNLLDEAGFDVKPVLVAERDYRKVNTSYPFLDQFSKVAAFVSLNDKTYVLDATDQYTPFGMLPESLLNTTAFVIDRKKGTLVSLKQPGEGYYNSYSIVAKVDGDMISSGRCFAQSRGYSALARIEASVPGNDNFIRNVLVKDYIALKVDSLQLEKKITPDSAQLFQRFVFSTPLEQSGEYFLLNPMPLSGLGKNPFTEEQRFSDINFGAARIFNFNYHLTLDPSLEVESIPRNLLLKLPGKELAFTRRVVHEKDAILINFKFEINLPYYSYEDYEFVKSFYKQMYEYLDEQIVLKKKS